ncbi:hypothetical protein ABH966_003539 [Lysinibacillus sp. RC46]
MTIFVALLSVSLGLCIGIIGTTVFHTIALREIKNEYNFVKKEG